ncbi:MAG: aminoglycoside phosphotransferase family protein, partial [Gammaproteobacteria bacterium]
GKTYYNGQGKVGQGEVAYRNMRRLWASDACCRGELKMARPMAYQCADRLLWQEGLPGRTLLSIARDGNLRRCLVERTAKAVAALHRSDIACTEEVGIDRILGKLETTRALIAVAQPGCAIAVSEVVDRLVAKAPDGSRASKATVHRDLHPKNIIVDADELAIIDLDDLARGPALQDIGSFVATMLCRAMLQGVPLVDVERTVESFLRCYGVQVPWPLPPAEIAWHTAAALIAERAFRCVTRLKPGHFAILADVIALADRIARSPDARSAWYVLEPGRASDAR